MNSTEKILLLTSGYPYGKGETFLENEIQFLASNFKEVLIISCNPSSDQRRQTPKNVNSIIFRPTKSKNLAKLFNSSFLNEFLNNMLSNPMKNKIAVNSWLIACELAKEIQGHITKTTVLYSYWLDDKALALSILKSKNANLKAVSRAHRWDIYEDEHLYQYLPFRKFLFHNLNTIFSISEDGIRYLNQKGATNVKLSRLGTVQTISKKDYAHKHLVHVISISYLIKRKRIGLLIDAIQLLDNKNYEIKWTHFGDGPELDRLKEKSKSIKNISVNFKGFVANPTLISWLQEHAHSCLLINLSESEGIPVSMMEAMSFSIPCIGTDVGGVSEIIQDKHNGFLLNPNPSEIEVADKLHAYYSFETTEKDQMKLNAHDTWEKKYNAEENFTSYCKELLNLL